MKKWAFPAPHVPLVTIHLEKMETSHISQLVTVALLYVDTIQMATGV